MVGNCCQKLEKWRDDCHQKIDRFFEQKCAELHRLADEKVDKQREKIVRIQSDVGELIQKEEATRQDIDLLTSTIRQLQEKMNDIEQTCFQTKIRPLVIDNNYIHITETNEHEINLSTISPVYKTVDRPNDSCKSMANNDRFLLMHQTPNLCLMDKEMNLSKNVFWPHGKIFDMCWSPTLDQFIVLEDNKVFLIDENTMSIKHVQTIEKRKWLSCICSDTFIFLLTNESSSSIMEFKQLPSIELVKQWDVPKSCARDEFIHDIAYNKGRLCLMIMNETDKSMHMELRSVENLNYLWSLSLDMTWKQNLEFRCCSLTCDEWLVADYETKRLLHVATNGKQKKMIDYSPNPYRVHLFGPNLLAILTISGINLHKLQLDD